MRNIKICRKFIKFSLSNSIMKLFLSGGGSGEKSVELDRKFAEAVDKSKPILYIPIAIDKETHPYPDCLKWLTSALKPFGITKIELWTEKELREKPERELEKFSGVYIGGGNTFYLMNELKESKFLPKLERLIKNDIPVYGGSAGAIIHAKSIITALSADANDVKLTEFKAMNLLSGYSLLVHYEPSMEKAVRDYQEEYGLKIVALPENCGLYVDEKDIRVVGPGSAYLFGKKTREIKPGKKI